MQPTRASRGYFDAAVGRFRQPRLLVIAAVLPDGDQKGPHQRIGAYNGGIHLGAAVRTDAVYPRTFSTELDI